MSIPYRIVFAAGTGLTPERIESHGYEIVDGKLRFLDQHGGILGQYPLGDVVSVHSMPDMREPATPPEPERPFVEYKPQWGDQPVRGATTTLPQLHRIFMLNGDVYEIRPKYVEHDPDGRSGASLFLPLSPGYLATDLAPGAQLQIPKQDAVIVERCDIDRIEIIDDFDAVLPDGSNRRTGHQVHLEQTQRQIGMPVGWSDLATPLMYDEFVPPPGTAIVVSDGYGIGHATRYLVSSRPANGRQPTGAPPDIILWPDVDFRMDYPALSSIEYATVVVQGHDPKLPRGFKLVRHVDVSGPSGVGEVAEGVLFSDGVAAVRWTTDWPTTVVHHDRGIESVHKLHGHNGATDIVWTDNGEVYQPPVGDHEPIVPQTTTVPKEAIMGVRITSTPAEDPDAG